MAVLPRDEAFAIPDLIRTKINLLPPGIDEIRTIEIVGLDLQADGGTHVANTREVGSIRVTGYESKGRINKRIRIELVDDRAEPQPARRAPLGLEHGVDRLADPLALEEPALDEVRLAAHPEASP